jgi:hypothetical protein
MHTSPYLITTRYCWLTVLVLFLHSALYAQTMTPRLAAVMLPPDSTATMPSKLVFAEKPGLQPIYVVDGVPQPRSFRIQDFNPDSIYRIQVIQPKKAARLFGPNNWNGVVVITTIRAQAIVRKQRRPVN